LGAKGFALLLLLPPVANGFALLPVANGFALPPVANGFALLPVANGFALLPVANGFELPEANGFVVLVGEAKGFAVEEEELVVVREPWPEARP
jgi:hypothetical protein